MINRRESERPDVANDQPARIRARRPAPGQPPRPRPRAAELRCRGRRLARQRERESRALGPSSRAPASGRHPWPAAAGARGRGPGRCPRPRVVRCRGRIAGRVGPGPWAKCRVRGRRWSPGDGRSSRRPGSPPRRGRRPPPYFTALSSSAHRTWSSWSGSATASQPRPRRAAAKSTSGALSASQARLIRGPRARTSGCGAEHAGLETGDREQLPDEARQAARLLGHDCQAAVRFLVRSCRSHLVHVGADAGQRRLQIVADASQELVLGRVQFEQPGVLTLDLAEQLGIAQGHADFAREQLEQILVGVLPARVAGRWPTSTPSGSAPARTRGPHRARIARHPLLGLCGIRPGPGGSRRRSSRRSPGRHAPACAASGSTPWPGE